MTERQKAPHEAGLNEELERRIVYGLALEFDHALGTIDPSVAAKMKKPLFRLNTTQHQLGAWHAGKREISISLEFALSNTWERVRAVLLHEMAHQLADEVLGATRESDHGPKFVRACKLLRADSKASGSLSDQNDLADPIYDTNQNRVLRRVRKLMALSNSENPHEAAAAMAKAHELILKFNLPLLERYATPTFTTLFLGHPALRHFREDYLLAHLLQEFYFVQGLWVSSYVLEKSKMGRVFEISGINANVKIAAYVYDCVRSYIEYQWKLFSSGKKLGRYRKSDFSAGIISGFHQKLATERYNHPLAPKEKALILIGDSHLKAYISERYPHTRSIRGSGAAINAGIYNQGILRGKRLSLRKGVEEKFTKRIKLIGN